MSDVRIDGASLPDMSDTLMGYFIPMVFMILVKSVVDFKNVEVATNFSTQGVWQPFTTEQLEMKPIGQRSWSWFMLHSLTDLVLKTDDVVEYKSVKYRVMQKNDYVEYGFFEYHLVRDFTGSGP